MDTLIQHGCNPPLPFIPEPQNGRPAVFLDRDGTLIVERHYLRNTDELLLFDDTIASLQQLQQAGLPLYIITNQAGIAHGFFTEKILQQIHHELIQRLNRAGVDIAGIFYCPHHPAAELAPYRCDCFGRKPNPGLLFQAAARDQLDLTRSYVIGDKLLDISAGKAVGAKTILVLTGYGEIEQAKISETTRPDCIAPSLWQAAQWITSVGLK